MATAEDLAKEPISITHNATIYDAIENILDRNISGILVSGNGCTGSISQKDIAQTLLDEKRHIKNITTKEKMQDLILVDRFAPLPNCADMMLKMKINMLGVKGSRGIRGVFTKHDMVRHYFENFEEDVRLKDVMTVGSFFVPDSTPIYDALKKMLENHISRMLVKDSKGSPVGIATFKNFLGKAMYQANRYEDGIFSSGFGTRCPIKNIMTKNIITISSKTSLARVARILIEHRIHGIAISEGKRIVGFVTEKDIIRQIANSDIQ